jgi:hypothetical protein
VDGGLAYDKGHVLILYCLIIRCSSLFEVWLWV